MPIPIWDFHLDTYEGKEYKVVVVATSIQEAKKHLSTLIPDIRTYFAQGSKGQFDLITPEAMKFINGSKT